LSLIFSKFSIIRISIFTVVYWLVQLFFQTGAGVEISIPSIISNIIAGFSIGLVMYLIFTRLPFRRMVCIGLAWLNLFIIQQLNNLIETLFFTTYLSSAPLFLGAVIAGTNRNLYWSPYHRLTIHSEETIQIIH